MKHLFIINPSSGKNTNISALIGQINALHLTAPKEIHVTDSAQSATQIIKNTASTYGKDLRIYAMGGDGTFNTAVNAAYMYPNAAVAPIPIGTGNDFVRSFENIEKQRFLDLEEMVNGSVHKIDLLMVGNRASVNMVTVGYDCAVAKEMERFKQLPFVGGSMAYNLSLIYCLISRMKNYFTLIADGEEIKDTYQSYLFAIAANGKYYGGGYKAAPDSSMQDGYIDFIRIPTISRLKFLQLVSVYKKGEHFNDSRMDFIKLTHCKSLEIISPNLIDVNLDGEIIPMRNPKITINPKAAKIILPAVPVFSKQPSKIALDYGAMA